MAQSIPRRLASVLLGALLIVVTIPAAAHAAAPDSVDAAALNLRTPFDCRQVWNANTRTNHSPQNAVDFQRSDALGKNVLSSGPGTVTVVRDLGNTSYGRYIVVRHDGTSMTTLYAHLRTFNTSVGAKVRTGQKIATVGSTGGSTGPHLHYEQRSNGTPVRVVLNGVAIRYFGNMTITSSTNC